MDMLVLLAQEYTRQKDYKNLSFAFLTCGGLFHRESLQHRNQTEGRRHSSPSGTDITVG